MGFVSTGLVSTGLVSTGFVSTGLVVAGLEELLDGLLLEVPDVLEDVLLLFEELEEGFVVEVVPEEAGEVVDEELGVVVWAEVVVDGAFCSVVADGFGVACAASVADAGVDAIVALSPVPAA